MTIGDTALFYHSSCPEPGIVGIVEIVSNAYPDRTQFEPKSKYFDPKATQESPRWFNVDIRFIRKTRLVSLQELRQVPELEEMRILAKGNRLSITPVSRPEWHRIEKLL